MRRIPTLLFCFAASAAVLAPSARAQGCPAPSSGPDLSVGEIGGVAHWGAVGSIGAYSFQVTSCNLGDAEADWRGGDAAHPLTVQGLYRLEDGRFEQLGLSWAHHATAALSGNACCDCVPSGSSARLGVGCSTTSSAAVGGSQGLLGPRSEVDAATGSFPFPFSTQGQGGDAIYKRLQVEASELDPAQHPGARYFVACQHVAADDAAAGNAANDSSWREAVVLNSSGGQWHLGLVGPTERGASPLEAWGAADPGVSVRAVDVPGEGRFVVASRATGRGDGTFVYSYAVFNANSTRAAGALEVAIPAGAPVTERAFHDVHHHSGEPYATDDWSSSVGASAVRFETVPFATDPNANALRWGTTYSFRFVAPSPPQPSSATLELFLPGGPASVSVPVVGPGADGSPGPYCQGAPHSAGPGAAMDFEGTVSLAANDFRLVSRSAPPLGFGLFFYGANAIQVPFGDGFRCVGGATFRLQPPLQTDGSGDALRPLDFQSPPLAGGPGAIAPGLTWNFQHWFRDAPAMGAGFNLSNGLSATFVP